MQRPGSTEETRNVKYLKQKWSSSRTCQKANVATAAGLWGDKHETQPEGDILIR